MGIPWLAIFFFVFLRPFGGSPGSVAFMFAVWFGIGAVIDVTVTATARGKLLREFRRAAAEGFKRRRDEPMTCDQTSQAGKVRASSRRLLPFARLAVPPRP